MYVCLLDDGKDRNELGRYKTTRCNLVGTLLRSLNQLSLNILLAHGRDIHLPFKTAVRPIFSFTCKFLKFDIFSATLFLCLILCCHVQWREWLKSWEERSDWELLVRTLMLSQYCESFEACRQVRDTSSC